MLGALVSLGKRQFDCDHLLRLRDPIAQDPSPPHRATTAPAHGLYLTHVGYDVSWPEESLCEPCSIEYFSRVVCKNMQPDPLAQPTCMYFLADIFYFFPVILQTHSVHILL